MVVMGVSSKYNYDAFSPLLYQGNLLIVRNKLGDEALLPVIMMLSNLRIFINIKKNNLMES
jgi:hypothetical protein